MERQRADGTYQDLGPSRTTRHRQLAGNGKRRDRAIQITTTGPHPRRPATPHPKP